jgi:SAM-dependent methyltransferase
MSKLLTLTRDVLNRVGLDLNVALDRGVSFANFNMARLHHQPEPRSEEALRRCLALAPGTVLDVGSGGGEHARRFASGGAEVTCVDFGTSIYAKTARAEGGVKTIHCDFTNWKTEEKFDLVWASHVLEHQRNVGLFIEKLISCTREGGYVAITVPSPHRRLWGGHVSLWTPGLLAYNVALCGVDLSKAQLFYGYREMSLLFSPTIINLPDLTYDSGDLNRLSALLPNGFNENSDPWV